MLTDLDLDITNEELSAAIGTMKGGKTPGPDGIPIESYKTFQDVLTPPLLEMYKDSLDSESPPLLSKHGNNYTVVKAREIIYPMWII